MAIRLATLTVRSPAGAASVHALPPEAPDGAIQLAEPPPTHALSLASGEPNREDPGGPDTYLNRSMVDAGPQPLGLIQVPYPEGETPSPAAGHENTGIVGRLTLYIDEHGAVRRVQVHGGELPPPFEAAARNAFLQARFTPAQKQGQAVKVRIDIEVRFDDQALIAAPTATGETRT